MADNTTAPKRFFTKESTNMAKGAAILLMLFYHLFSSPSDNALMQVDHSPLPENIFLMLANFGNICVAVFVFLTAYGISIQLFSGNNLSLKDAYKDTPKRLARMFSHFVFMFCIVNLLWFRHFNYSLCYGEGKQGVLSFLTDALGLAHLLGTPTLNMTWWYMSIAYTLIFLIPLLAVGCKKTGYPFLGIAFLLPYLLPSGNDISRYFFVMALGITAAYGNWFEKILNSGIPAAVRFLAEAAALVFFVFTRENAFVQDHMLYIFDALIAFAIILFVSDCIGLIPGIRKVFAFLGRHSMNIYFVHTFFYLILYRNYIFYFKYAAVTFLILLGLSLLLSLLMEGLKALIRFLLKKIKRRSKTE